MGEQNCCGYGAPAEPNCFVFQGYNSFAKGFPVQPAVQGQMVVVVMMTMTGGGGCDDDSDRWWCL